MNEILKFTTSPESYSIEISIQEELYSRTLSPVFNRLEYKIFPLKLKKQELIRLKEALEEELRTHTQKYQPRKGNSFIRTIFGIDYRLSLLSKQHQAISGLYNVHEIVEDCIQKNYALNIFFR